MSDPRTPILERIWIATYPVQDDGTPSADLPASPPALSEMVELTASNIAGLTVTEELAPRETGGVAPTVIRRARGIVDVTALSFIVDYDETTSPPGKLNSADSVLNHGECVGWDIWVVGHPHGSGAGRLQEAWLARVNSCPRVAGSNNEAWMFNVQCGGRRPAMPSDQ